MLAQCLGNIILKMKEARPSESRYLTTKVRGVTSQKTSTWFAKRVDQCLLFDLVIFSTADGKHQSGGA